MDNFERETQNDITNDFMLYEYQNRSPRPEKKDSSIKAMQWCMAVFMLILSASAVFFGINGTEGILLVFENSHSVPSNRYLESSYATNTDISDAPDVSADINGPQISVTENKSSERNSANHAYTTASPSIVNITSYEAGTDYALTKSGDGSGIIITSDGYIATNSHVVDNSTKTGTMITLFDGSQYLGTVIGIDKKNRPCRRENRCQKPDSRTVRQFVRYLCGTGRLCNRKSGRCQILPLPHKRHCFCIEQSRIRRICTLYTD